MFCSFWASCARHCHLKTKPINSESQLKCDNEETSTEYLLQKYLFDHYMNWKIDCFHFSHLPGPTSSFIFEFFPFSSSRFVSRSLGVYAGLSSFSNKNQTASINKFSLWFQSYICATIVHPRENGQLRRRTREIVPYGAFATPLLSLSMANSASFTWRSRKTFLNTSARQDDCCRL